MPTIEIYPEVGAFAEDKDAAAHIRQFAIEPALEHSGVVQIDFSDVTLVTQSFVHALISGVIRVGGEEILDRIDFKGCVPGVRGIIETVVQYSLDTGMVEDFTEQETQERLDQILTGAFQSGPTSLADIPKKDGDPRSPKSKTLKKKKS
ncbi:MAG TPA: DUF4325 domain-containing protein [Rhizomicrobium sp.]|jgi:hypothetical protein|nr:DUF4325 domain-containing protein [Rhizomicrobium sp.]